MTFWLFMLFYFIWANLFRHDPVVQDVEITDVTISKIQNNQVVETEIKQLSETKIPQISFKTVLNESRLEFLIRHTWDGEWVSHRPAMVTLTGQEQGLNVTIEAPYFGDPPAPTWNPAKPYFGLWNHEEIELFFSNDDDHYLQAELGPHGQHLALIFKEKRKSFKEALPLTYKSEISLEKNTWHGETVIPWSYFPPKVTKFNTYGMHGSGEGRQYDAAFPVPKGTKGPDFHNLEYFSKIPFKEILPESFSNTVLSEVWMSEVSLSSSELEDVEWSELSYHITQTWDSQPLEHDGIRVTLSQGEEGLDIAIEAPYFGDPPAPDGPPGEPFYGLWDYEVVETFFLNEDDQYIELEFSPHGQHLVLLLIAERNMSLSELPLDYKAEISSDGRSWLGHATVPWDYFPPQVTRFNAYAIHGSGDNRTYEALYMVPKGIYDEPDFHRLDYFEEINFESLQPEDFDNTEPSILWTTPEDLASKEDVGGEVDDVDVSELEDVPDQIDRDLTVPPEMLEDESKQVQVSDARESGVGKHGELDEPSVPELGAAYLDEIPDRSTNEEEPDMISEEARDADKKAVKIPKIEENDDYEIQKPGAIVEEDAHSKSQAESSVTEDSSEIEDTGIIPPLGDIPDQLMDHMMDLELSMDMSSETAPKLDDVLQEPPVSKIPSLRFSVSKTWDGRPTGEPSFNITMSPTEAGLLLNIEAPYFEDPPMPIEAPKKPFYGIDAHEVIHLFFLNDQNRYLEVILGPHGHYHIRTYFEKESISLEGLSLNVTTQIFGVTWEGETVIPWTYFPPRITKFNIYTAHGTRHRRVYYALYPATNIMATEPNTHALQDYRFIDFKKVLPATFDNSHESIIWASIDTLLEQDLIRGKKRRRF